MRTSAARDTVTPTLHKAQETLTDTVLPTVRDALSTARGKSADLLDSDVAHEARRRGIAVLKAAKGEAVVAPARRGWRFGLGMLTLGTAFGVAATWIARRLQVRQDDDMWSPVPSGTVTTDTTASGTATGNPVAGVTTQGGPVPAGTPAEDIDLATGSPRAF